MKLITDLMPTEVAKTLSEEKQRTRQSQLEKTDAFLIRLFREKPLGFWCLGIGLGLALWAFSYGFAVFLDWLTK